MRHQACAGDDGLAAAHPMAHREGEEVLVVIDLYYWPTPNGWKVSIMLEEAGLPYRVVPVNIGRGEQFRPEFLAISPNNRMPAIVDTEPAEGGAPISVFESGAILLYLAEKSGKFLPADLRGRYEVMQWLLWQMGGLGPMAGQAHHFRQYAPEPIPYAIDRYTNEVQPALRGDEPAPRGPRVPRRRVLDRRHGGVPLGGPVPEPGAAALGLPQPRALVHGHEGAARGRPRARGRQGAADERQDGRRGQEDPLRPDGEDARRSLTYTAKRTPRAPSPVAARIAST